MKIAIDMQSCLTDSRYRGIGRYSMGLVENLLSHADETVEFVACLDATDPARLQSLRRTLRARHPGLRTLSYSYPSSGFTDQSPPLHRAASLLKANFYRAIEPDAVLVTSFFEFGTNYSAALDKAALMGIPSVVIAYDLIPLIFPEKYLPEGSVVSAWYPKCLEEFKRFDLFLAISEATRDDLVRYLDIPPERIRVIGTGLDEALAAMPDDANDVDLSELGVHSPYVLMVGNGDWRKNCIGALRAFADLPKAVRSEHQLVLTQVGDDVLSLLAGEYSWLQNRVIIAGKVSEKCLARLYSQCKVFYFPSFYEGFGLPVLEAMAFGAPVLSSSCGALPEVVHDRRALFDPRDRKASTEILRRALVDDEFRADLKHGAREHALKFTWGACAKAALDAITECVAEQRAAPGHDWQPTDGEIRDLSSAVIVTGEPGITSLRRGLEAIASKGHRRILVDVSEVARLDARSGIQRVVRNYCAGLIRLRDQADTDFSVEPIQWTEQGIIYARSLCRERLGLDVEGEDLPVNAQADDLVFMVDSSWWAPERFLALHEDVRKAGGEVVWMVYDLVPIQTPELCDPVMPPVFRAWLDFVARTSDGCICISDATARELTRYFADVLGPNAPQPWVRYVHLGSDMESGSVSTHSSEIDEVVARISQSGYCIALSTVEPRKDYATILKAFERIWQQGSSLSLVIVGKQGWNVDALANVLRGHKELGSRLFWFEGAGDGDVNYLLRNARALIQASAAEGFGLAVAEAGALGVPLFISDIPVFHEIAGDNASYFKVGDAEALACILRKAETSSAWKAPRGMNVLSWAESTQKVAKALTR